MKRVIIVIFLAIVTVSLKAQYIIDLSYLDYIEADTESLNGYRKSGDIYIEYVYDSYLVDRDMVKMSEYERDSIYTEVVKVSGIPKMSISDWENLLDKHDLIWNDRGNIDKEEVKLFIKKSPYYILSAELWFNQDTSEIEDDSGKSEYGKIKIDDRNYNVIEYGDQYSINYIKLKGDKYLLCLINDHHIYKVIPDKNKKLKLTPFLTEKKAKINNIRISSEREFAFFDVEEWDSGKSVIVNSQGMPTGICGDKIIFSQGPVAVYQNKTKSYDFYDSFLNKINNSHDNIRYVKASSNWLILLIDNELAWLVKDKVEKFPVLFSKSFSVCGTVTYYADTINYTDGKIKLKKAKDHQMLRKGIEYFSYDINDTQGIDSLYFYGKKERQQYSTNSYFPFFSQISEDIQAKDLLFAKKTNGKYNLYAYKEISSEMYKMDIEVGNEEPVTKYFSGEVELIPLLPRDVDSITMEFPILFEEANLYGVYGINSKAKYRVLKDSRENKLMRYELPTGEQGWLDLDTGKEFEDI